MPLIKHYFLPHAFFYLYIHYGALVFNTKPLLCLFWLKMTLIMPTYFLFIKRAFQELKLQKKVGLCISQTYRIIKKAPKKVPAKTKTK